MNCANYFFFYNYNKKCEPDAGSLEEPNIAIAVFFKDKSFGEVIIMEIIYDRYNHAVGQNFWHFEWCTKYRYKMFSREHYRTLCYIVMQEGAKRYNIQLVELNIQADHTHMVASLPRGMTDIKALNLLKGYAARLLFMLCPEFRNRYSRGHLWSKGSFSTTVGFAELKTVLEYVRNQDIHHAA